MDVESTSLEELSAQPREHIPDTWAHRGSCPVCGRAKSLAVLHKHNAPDQFVCEYCNAAFELPADGSQIRLMVLPEILQAVWNQVIHQWIEPAEIRLLYKRCQASLADEEVDQQEITLTNREVYYKALELQKLGNDDETTASLLFQAGATRQQVVGVLRKRKREIEKERKRRNRFFLVMAVLSLFVLALIAGGVWLTTLNQVPNEEIVEEPGGEREALFVELLSEQAQPRVEDAAVPQVEQGNVSVSGTSSCPTTPAQAAELFGGPENVWAKESSYDAWVMTNAGLPITLYVPSGMVAGYMDLTSMEMISVDGPVTIRNVNFAVITCY
jgi:hypothetical protein